MQACSLNASGNRQFNNLTDSSVRRLGCCKRKRCSLRPRSLRVKWKRCNGHVFYLRSAELLEKFNPGWSHVRMQQELTSMQLGPAKCVLLRMLCKLQKDCRPPYDSSAGHGAPSQSRHPVRLALSSCFPMPFSSAPTDYRYLKATAVCRCSASTAAVAFCCPLLWPAGKSAPGICIV